MTNYDDRRKYNRIAINAEAQVTLLIPELTFSPYTIRGVATDISLGGICLICYQLSKKDYIEMVRGMSHVKVELFFPIFKDPIHLKGRVVWADYHDGTKDDTRSFCKLGIANYNFTDEAKKEFKQVLEILAAQLDRQNTEGVFKGVDLRKQK